MSDILDLKVCSEFCSLLLSKPLVLLEIPELKKVLEYCGSSVGRSCCGSSKKDFSSVAENESFKVISSLSKDKMIKMRDSLISKKENSNINIKFDNINKNIII